MTNTTPVRVRFAPSPTGYMHLGHARTALYGYLLAKQSGGSFMLRIEDTDQKRYVADAVDNIATGLKWLGLQWDEGIDVGGEYGPYRQTERLEIYNEHVNWLLENGHAFYCFCSQERLQKVREEQRQNKENPHYDGTCRNISLAEARDRIANGEKAVVRFKMPKEGSITVHEEMRGDITEELKNLDDYILVKSNGIPVYHLAAMVDDHLMEITHVFRGSEWLPSLPQNALLYRTFGWEEPKWCHLSVFLKPSGKGKLSKRDSAQFKEGGYSVMIHDLEDLGYLPEAVNNWVALMGWAYDDHTEFFTMQDLIDKFSIAKLNPKPSAINFSKLDHFNGLHIRALDIEDLARRIQPFFTKVGLKADMETLVKIAPIIQERLKTLDEAPEMAGFFFQDEVIPVAEELIQKKMTAQDALNVAKRATEILEAASGMTHDAAEAPLRDLVEELGLNAGQVFGVVRVAVTGQRVSPPLFESMEIIGKETVMLRMRKAVELLEELVASE
ncbi:MAG: glutamate--tRNA ligase [Anaerolineae bacterium]|jgi:glutamyl-tRNA synthetase|nr:glutamate--tRNA ligase [Anaerolineae bacterium]